ncbi:hypothetical protein ACHAPT_003947 [Fusarium lateritium]
MEISDEVFDSILTPTAAQWNTPSPNQAIGDWETSSLNPKNRVDSLQPPKSSRWRFEGIEPSGTRYFIVPEFAIGKPPLRIDVFVPRYRDQPKELRQHLRSNLSVLHQGADALGLDITKHLLRALDVWSTKNAEFENKYLDLPFGSRVVVENISSSVNDMNIHLIPIYDVERQWLTLAQLGEQWQLPSTCWPPVISIQELSLCRQFHEAITIAKLPRLQGDRLFVFKSLTRDVKYLYHELRMLMTMPNHEHILGKPLYIVTKRCKFGRKVGVCGFVMEYYPGGTLRGLFLDRHEAARVTMTDKFRWAQQITNALLFIQDSPLGYYPDLKPDNIILRAVSGSRDILLIDLEQRGGWYSWTPRDVSYVEFVEYMASATPDMVIKETADGYAKLMKAWDPAWQAPTRTVKYDSAASENGYSNAWSQLSPMERESAQVYMLGKLLWCIFECRASINCGVSPDILREDCSEHRFPEFINTPEPVRTIIQLCTAGAVEWHGVSRPVKRYGCHLVLQNLPQLEDEVSDMSSMVQDAARRWWQQELGCAERYMKEKLAEKNKWTTPEGEPWSDNPAKFVEKRPSLAGVQGMLASAAEGLKDENT